MPSNNEMDDALQKVQKNNKTDWGALATRGVLGAVPWVGGLLGELINELIPNLRQDRIVCLLNLFSEKIKKLDEDLIRLKLHDPYNIDLFEDACFQTIRALSNERINYIANALTHSLTNEQLEYSQKKKLISLLGKINDSEVIILFYYQAFLEGAQKEYLEKHKNILFIPPATHSSPPEEIEREIIHNSYKDHLVQIGLLRDYFPFVKRNQIPEFDNHTGKFKGGRKDITPLGRALCDFIQDEIKE